MKTLFLIASAAGMLLFPGCSDSGSPMNTALNHALKGEWKAADKPSEEAAKSAPENVNANLLRSLICEKLNNYDQAVEYALRAHTIDSSTFLPLYTLGRLYAADPRRQTEACDLLFKANRLRPDHGGTLVLLANLHPVGKKLPYLSALEQLPEYQSSLELRFESAMDRVYRGSRRGVDQTLLKLFNEGSKNPELTYAIAGYFYRCGSRQMQQVAKAGYQRYLKFPQSLRTPSRTTVAKDRIGR